MLGKIRARVFSFVETFCPRSIQTKSLGVSNAGHPHIDMDDACEGKRNRWLKVPGRDERFIKADIPSKKRHLTIMTYGRLQHGEDMLPSWPLNQILSILFFRGKALLVVLNGQLDSAAVSLVPNDDGRGRVSRHLGAFCLDQDYLIHQKRSRLAQIQRRSRSIWCDIEVDTGKAGRLESNKKPRLIWQDTYLSGSGFTTLMRLVPPKKRPKRHMQSTLSRLGMYSAQKKHVRIFVVLLWKTIRQVQSGRKKKERTHSRVFLLVIWFLDKPTVLCIDMQ